MIYFTGGITRPAARDASRSSGMPIIVELVFVFLYKTNALCVRQLAGAEYEV